VLLFASLSTDVSNALFGDGLADEIITALTRVEGLKVTARTSSFAFRDKREDVRKIGDRLGSVPCLKEACSDHLAEFAFRLNS
jgi:adenylate cyclase